MRRRQFLKAMCLTPLAGVATISRSKAVDTSPTRVVTPSVWFRVAEYKEDWSLPEGFNADRDTSSGVVEFGTTGNIRFFHST